LAEPDIFLSYNREDAQVARRFADAFVADGFDVWWDQALRSGEAYDEVTEAALRGAKAVVVLWSPRSVTSRWVRAEATIGERNGTLVPVRIEPCDLPVMFELTQTADLTHWQGGADDRAWLAFLGDVRRMVGKEAPATAAPVATATAPAGSGIPILAVLPISPRGGGDLKFLAEDLTEEITRELSHDSFFDVTAAGVIATAPGKQLDHRVLGQDLGVRYLAEGKLQQAGENIRLTMQIVDTATGKMAWTKRFNGQRDAVDAAPDQLAATIASEVGEQILRVESDRAINKPGPYSAWEHVVRGMAYTGRMGSDSDRRSIEESRQAVAAAPDLGIAHAALAATLGQLVNVGGERLDDALEQEIREHMIRAMQLAGNEPVVVGWLSPAYASLGDWDTQLRLARRMVDLYPNSPRSHFVFGCACLYNGRIADAIAAFERQDSLSSYDLVRFSGLASLGACYLLEGRQSEANSALDRSLALHPDFHIALKWRAIAAAQQGEEQSALAAVRHLRRVEPEMTLDHHLRQLKHGIGIADRLEEPVATLRRLWDATEGGEAGSG